PDRRGQELDVVRATAVVLVHAGANDRAVVAVVHVDVGVATAPRIVVEVVTDADRRHVLAAAVEQVHLPGGVGGSDGHLVADLTVGHDVAVDVEAADALVDVDELLEADHAIVERLETILHADVIPRRTSLAGLR